MRILCLAFDSNRVFSSEIAKIGCSVAIVWTFAIPNFFLSFPTDPSDVHTRSQAQGASGPHHSHTINILKYGSDPLKTYLPDSDIDVTIILNNNLLKKGDSEAKYMQPIEQLQLIQSFLQKYQ